MVLFTWVFFRAESVGQALHIIGSMFQVLPLDLNVPGIFCAGDVRANSVKRIASAVGEGAMAVRFVHQHLADL